MSRLLFPRIAVLLIFTILVGRLYQLQLVDTAADRFRYTTGVSMTRYLPTKPIRGEILANDGMTLLAESVPIYTVAIRPADLPAPGSQRRTTIFAQLSHMLGISSTLTLTPSVLLEQDATLRGDLIQGLGLQPVEQAQRQGIAPEHELRFDVPPDRSLEALKLSEAYSTTLAYGGTIADMVENADIPGYQTLPIEADISREIALILRENASSLPGVVVEQDYRRRYPLSSEIQSLSHTLGYIGRVNECELVKENSARSWVVGLMDSIGHAVDCGIIEKQINPYEQGIPRYLNNDRIGKDGIEASFETYLRGEMGIDRVVVDALGRPVRAPQSVHETRDGDSIVLTIDIQLQKQVEQILRNWIVEGERRRQVVPDNFAYKREYAPITNGVAIVMEVRTGRILAMASWPSYDNNVWDPSRASELTSLFYSSDPERQKELIRLAPLTNRAIAGQYPPGSTLKQFDALVAMQQGIIAPDTKIRDPGRLIVEDQFVAGKKYVYPNSSVRDNQWITVSDALMVSSNVFFMSVAGGNKEGVINLKDDEKTIDRPLNITSLADGLEWFGLGRPTNVALAGEAPGRVPTPAWKQRVQRAAWTTGDTYNVSIGQGNLEVTPLQLITAAASVANDGLLYRPQIASAIRNSSGEIVQAFPPELVRRIPAELRYFQVVREGMRRSVTEGINIAARDECSGLQIAGKTGTAEFGPEITIPTADGKSTTTVRQSHSWFVGFAPYDNPEIQVLVLSEGTGDLDNGSASITVPAVTQIMQAYFGVMPPDPLPRTCQQGMPPLPARTMPGATPDNDGRHMLHPRDR